MKKKCNGKVIDVFCSPEVCRKGVNQLLLTKIKQLCEVQYFYIKIIISYLDTICRLLVEKDKNAISN